MSDDDARAMVRRYGARQARREAALPIALLSGLGLGLAALAAGRRRADRNATGLSRAEDNFAPLASAAHGIVQRRESLAHDARARVARAGSRSLQLAQEPLAVGAVGLALGLAVAAIWPPTATERRLLGPVRRRLLDEAGDLATHAAEQVRDTLQEAISAVSPENADAESGAGQSATSADPAPRTRKRKAAQERTADPSIRPPEA